MGFRMKSSKKIIVISVIISIIVVSLFFVDSRLTERFFYRLGFQEQICFSELDASTKSDKMMNIAVVSDFGINQNSMDTLNNIQSVNPEIILFPGDLGQSNFNEWENLTKSIDLTNVYVTLGDAEENEFRHEFLEYHNLTQNYYSFDYENIHFLAISTETRENFSDDRIQIEFIRKDLEQNSNNSNIDWTIVFMHHPMYSSRDSGSYMDLRNELQPIFDSFGVDLVLSGHKHAYERTNSISFNNVILGDEKCEYQKSDGQIYLTVGTGGHSHSIFNNKESWSIIQNDNDYGFLNLVVPDNQDILYGEFISNAWGVVDSFKIKNNGM